MDIQINKSKASNENEFPEQTKTPVMKVTRNVVAKQRLINRVLLVVLLIAIALGGYFYYKLHKLEIVSNNVNQESQDLLAKVAKLYLIPIGEEPVVATVSDPTKLKDQAFFSSSQKDDKVLIFKQAGKAVLYRPSINKIIEIAPINNNQKDATPPEKSTGPIKDKTF